MIPPAATFERHAGQVTACVMMPDGRRILSISGEQTLKIWDLDSGNLLSTFDSGTDGVTACAVTPDGRRVIAASRNRTFKIWDVASGRVLTMFGSHDDRVTACAVTPDGRYLISASEDRTLRVWHLDDGRAVATLSGHFGRVVACAVTPDGRRVVSASEDRTLRVWDLASSACLFVHQGDVGFTSIAAVANMIVAGDSAGTVWMLDWPDTPTASIPAIARRAIPSRHVILFLAANPNGTTRLDLDDECAAIERELSMTAARHEFEFHSKWAVSVDEMMRHLNELQPTIIHFSGHGGDDDARRHDPRAPYPGRDIEVADGAGIILEDEHQQRQHVSERALAQMIGSAAPGTRVVVLNACYSDRMADALSSVVDCVVGMRGAIEDRTARTFSVGFYRALGNRCSIGNAVSQARATLAAKQLPDAELPMCETRKGVSADDVVLPSVNLRGP